MTSKNDGDTKKGKEKEGLETENNPRTDNDSFISLFFKIFQKDISIILLYKETKYGLCKV